MVHFIWWFSHGLYHTLHVIWVAHILCQVCSNETLKVNIGLVWMNDNSENLITARVHSISAISLHTRSVWSVFGSETYLTY